MNDARNYLAHYCYAYVLSREECRFRFCRRLQRQNVEKIRESLRKAIALNPKFAESYHLTPSSYCYNERLDEAWK